VTFILQFLPELVLLAGALALFMITIGENAVRRARLASIIVAGAVIAAAVVSLGQAGSLFFDAYRVDAFSQWLKLVFAVGYLLVVLLTSDAPDVRGDIRAEYFLFLSIAMIGFVLLVSSVELITLVVSLELSSFPLYLLVAMRRERPGQRAQMESAIKYIMFGVAANGIMLFGLSYLYGLTGTTHLADMMVRLGEIGSTPLVVVGLSLAFAGLYYKLAVFPFHFWTPDVYEGASNETAGLVASLPKLGAVVVFVRFVSLAPPDGVVIVGVFTVLAAASMLYGNLVALVQRDFKRLLGFSGIAHAGYALLGFVAFGDEGFAAALYYITGYVVMVLACFVVISRVSRDGANLAIEELAGLHKRSPLLAATLVIGVFSLAGIPPFVGFMGKFSLLSAALAKGHLALVIIAVLNAVVAVYYYLRVIRESVFGDTNAVAERPAIVLDWPTRALCVVLIAAIVGLGVAPSAFIDTIAESLAALRAAALAVAG
jgi:NADH-quinone oxidoreductase subunit N